MKKITFFVFVLVAMLLVSCGSSKSGTSNPYGKEMVLTESEAYALQKPGKRAAGKGESYDESAARQLAELDARATFSNALASAIVSAAKKSNVDITQYAGSTTDGMTATDGGGQANTMAKSISTNIIKNTNIVKVNKFFGNNRVYTIFVCLEYIGEIEDMAKEAAQQVKQRVSDEDRAKIQYELEKFEKEIKNDLINNMRK